jgi:carboxypeptidase family protein/TonB-dependent receptor-like protein
MRTRQATFLVAILSSLPMAVAQTVTGVISGRVVDTAGLGIPKAEVTLIHEEIGERRQITSSETGDFVFTAIQPGRYMVAVQAAGMKRLEKKNLNLTAAERLSVGELTLEVGTVSESVTVTAQGTPVQTTSQERSAVLTKTQIETLMTRSRDFIALLRVLPGVVYGAENDVLGPSTGPTVNGLRNTFNTYSIDGLTMNDLGSTQVMYNPTNMEAVGEVKVLLNNYQAEYGRNAGAIVNAVTKSGTQQFHGSGYIYKRHEQFNANTFFNNLNNLPKPSYRYTTGGFSIGGPLYWPGKINPKRDRLFFFFAQETVRGNSPQPLVQRTVPTQLERQGDFSRTLELNGLPVVIRDPLITGPFPNAIIPSSRINLNGQKILEVFPLPNQLDRNVTRGNYNYNFQESIFQPKQHNLFRVDASATAKLRMYFRGSIWREENHGHRVGGGSEPWGYLKSNALYTDDAGVYSLTHVMSPTLVHEFSMGAHHSFETSPPFNVTEAEALNRAARGMTLPQFYHGQNVFNLVPWASFGGVPNAARISNDLRFPKRGSDVLFTWSDGWSKIRGHHTMKFGFYAERARNYEGERGVFAGDFDFSRDVNNPNDSGWAYGNALLGEFRSYQESNTRIGTLARGSTIEWYTQDNWKVTRKLTFDYGMRLTTVIPYWQADGKAVNFDPQRFDRARQVVFYEPALDDQRRRVARNPRTGELFPAVFIGAFVPGIGDPNNGAVLQGEAGYPRAFVNNPGIQWGPRIGFAYDVFGDGKTAVRGGGGIFYNTRPSGGEIGDLGRNPPSLLTPTIYYGNLNSYINSSGVLFPSSFQATAQGGELPTVYNYSLGIQRDIGFQTVVDAAYVASLGRHLLQRRDINAIPQGARFQTENQDATTGRPLQDNFFRTYVGYADIVLREPASSSNYHSLQTQVNRRFSKGIQFGAAWTWSKAMNFADSDTNTVAAFVPIRIWNYGKAGYDRTHNLTMNWVWDLPKLSQVWNHRGIRAVFDNWELAGIASFVSGSPLGVGLGTVDGADITGGGDGARVVVLGKATLPKSDRTLTRYFDTAVFARPAQGSIGNAPRDVIRGPGINNWDVSVFKHIPIRERASFQLRWEMYNAFNHTQFEGVDTGTRFDTTGRQTNTRFGALISNRDARRMQASLRFVF